MPFACILRARLTPWRDHRKTPRGPRVVSEEDETMNQSFDVSPQSMSGTRKNEGKTTALIEQQTSRLPSMTYLLFALGSIVLSAGLAASARPVSRFGNSRRLELANFVGQWAPTLLTIGVYNKLVKIEHELLGRPGNSP
jgi:hypothetical protein